MKLLNTTIMKKIILLLGLFVTIYVQAGIWEEKEFKKVDLKKDLPKDDDRTSNLLEAYENDVTLSIYPYLSISNATVIISGNGVMDRYSLSLGANQLQNFNIGGYNEGNYVLQIILPDGEILSGDFMIE